MDARRSRLALWWGSFVLLWCGAVVALLGPITYLGRSAENLELEDGSPKERYCDGIDDFLRAGEPSELTTPLPYVLPLAALAAVGAVGIWRRSRRFVTRAALVAVAALVAHVVLVIALPG